MRQFIKKILPQNIKKFIYNKMDNYFLKSYSQEGEDLILKRYFENNNICDGFYVDIGAHHPMRFSNTYFFYLKGWRGINIEPRPGVKELFDLVRPEDTNLELAISDREEILDYYEFNDPALNSFSKNYSETIDSTTPFKIVSQKKIKACPLGGVLKKYMPENRRIDFFSIDVEGLELNVLKSNDWDKFRPRVIAVEILDFKLDKIYESEVYKFLSEKKYVFFAKTLVTYFFYDAS